MKSLATIPLALLASTAPLAALDLFKVDPELTVRITIETQSQSIDSVKGDDGGLDNKGIYSRNKFESRDTRYGAEVIQTLPIPVIPVPVGIHLGGGLAYTQRKMNLLGGAYENERRRVLEADPSDLTVSPTDRMNARSSQNDQYGYDINQLLFTGILGTEVRLPLKFGIDADLLAGIGSSQVTSHLSMVRTDGVIQSSNAQSDLGLTYEYGLRVGTHVLFFDALQVGVYAGWKEQRADFYVQHNGQNYGPTPTQTVAGHAALATTTHERLQVKQNGIFFMLTAGVTF